MFAYTFIRCCDHGHISESDTRLFLQLFHVVPRALTVHTVYAVETRFSEPLVTKLSTIGMTIPSMRAH